MELGIPPIDTIGATANIRYVFPKETNKSYHHEAEFSL